MPPGSRHGARASTPSSAWTRGRPLATRRAERTPRRAQVAARHRHGEHRPSATPRAESISTALTRHRGLDSIASPTLTSPRRRLDGTPWLVRRAAVPSCRGVIACRAAAVAIAARPRGAGDRRSASSRGSSAQRAPGGSGRSRRSSPARSSSRGAPRRPSSTSPGPGARAARVDPGAAGVRGRGGDRLAPRRRADDRQLHRRAAAAHAGSAGR